MDYMHITEIHLKELKIFYVLDTSGSMNGGKIAALNDAMRSTVEELKKENGEQARLKIGVMHFDVSAEWVTESAEDLDDFVWQDLEAYGLTSLGAALDKLNTALSRNNMMRSDVGNKAPVIIFMSDGYPTDDWESALKKIAENRWYRHAIKIAFAIGNNADRDSLAKVIGVKPDGSITPNYEAVISTDDMDTFGYMIKGVSVRSARVSASDLPADSGEIVREAAEWL